MLSSRFLYAVLGLALSFAQRALLADSATNPIVRFQTDLGNIDVVLLQDVAPNTVANFLRYMNRGDYDGSFIHRSPPSFVIQGGGYKFVNNQVQAIPTDPPVANEFHVSNTRGTLAMAKLSGDPNSATSQWFFNESDSNAGVLDTQNGGFTVFGRVISSAGLSVMDAIATLPIYDLGTPFDQLPLRNYSGGAVQDANLVHIISLKVFIPTVTLTHPNANTVHLQTATAPQASYRLETSLTLSAASFTGTTILTADASGNISYDDSNPGTRKFYRLVRP